MNEPAVLRVALQCAEAFEQSSTQWRDVVQILRLAAGTLDAQYLREWSGRLGVQALLQQAMTEAG